MSAGTCFGFDVRSDLEFAYLREGDGDPLEVVAPAVARQNGGYELVLEWQPPIRARLYTNGSGFGLWIERTGWFEIDPAESRIAIPGSADTLRREEQLWGIPAVLAFAARGDVPLHAAAVQIGAGAVLLAAPRTFGKTTLAAAFLRAGYRVLSEDLTCIRPSSPPAVVPGPAMLRLRRDVAERLELHDAIEVGRDPDRVHLAVARAGRGDCSPVPLRAIVILDSDDSPALLPVAPAEAIRDLLALSFRLQSPTAVRTAFTAIAELADAVPVRRLSSPRRLEALAETVAFLAENVPD